MDPIRSKQEKTVFWNPLKKRATDGDQSRIAHLIGDYRRRRVSWVLQKSAGGCGCVGAGEGGGFCICGALCCSRCFTHCAGSDCSKPIGPCCSVVVQQSSAGNIRLCKECYAKAKRKEIGQYLCFLSAAVRNGTSLSVSGGLLFGGLWLVGGWILELRMLGFWAG